MMISAYAFADNNPKYTFVDGETYTNQTKTDVGDMIYERTFDNTKWQTLYIPFSMSYDDWKETFDIAKPTELICNFYKYELYDFGDQYGEPVYSLKVRFKMVKEGKIEPNTPYLIRAKKSGVNRIEVHDVTLYPAIMQSTVMNSDFDETVFISGTYTGVKNNFVKCDGFLSVFNSNINMPEDTKEDILPMRWYLNLDLKNEELFLREISFWIFDDEGKFENAFGSRRFYNIIKMPITYPEKNMPITYSETNISKVKPDNQNDDNIFTLDGRMIDGKNLKSGVYIKNGKKYIVK